MPARTTGGMEYMVVEMERQWQAESARTMALLDRVARGEAVRPVFTYCGVWPVRDALDAMGREFDRVWA
jgi:hypothetical protein